VIIVARAQSSVGDTLDQVNVFEISPHSNACNEYATGEMFKVIES
jgi:hypothetical protein